MIDRKTFFDNIRSLHKGALTQSQVLGYGVILDAWAQRFSARTPLTQLGYVLATSYHETAGTMQPIKEYGSHAYFIHMYDVRGNRPGLARSMGNTTPGDGPRYCGRGFVQLTWRANYAKATDRLRELGVLSAFDSLVQSPDLAMRADIAAAILFEGMEGGWFTGRSLDDVIDAKVDGDEFADYVKARRIINGSDRADLIAGYAVRYQAALLAAAKAYRPGAPEKPAGGDEPSPAPSPPPAPQSPPAPAPEPARPIPVLPDPPPQQQGWWAVLASAARAWFYNRR